ncbi:helix-turn-helix domain-containing protein [Natronoarchaeum rubrum]|uniref:helix-turn-helix domain-containing protein n=1 Tax=Natronoarchaeum rubrum TaxID=755311 RepID=UPI0021138E05|nr:helix-turn-helix domain-containing protein [Natronoarchaeum rubrum]
MKHVRLTLDAGGREAEIHPMYDVMANAPFVERATAMHWNYSGEELGIMHYVEGDAERFRAAAESFPEVIDIELTRAGAGEFYAYVLDATNEPVRKMFEAVDRSPAVVIPPIEYAADGTVSYSVFGPGDEIQAAIERLPDPVDVTVEEIGGLAAVPGVEAGLLSDRQRTAMEAALSLGYYEIPREASHEDVAEAIGCAPSTAAEHLRKAEAKVVRSVLRT